VPLAWSHALLVLSARAELEVVRALAQPPEQEETRTIQV
jgi:hypothetical protein